MTASHMKIAVGLGIAALFPAAYHWKNCYETAAQIEQTAVVPLISEAALQESKALPVDMASSPAVAIPSDGDNRSTATTPESPKDWQQQLSRNLITDLSDPEWKIRRGTASTLINGDVPAALAVPALIDTLADEEWHVRKAVAQALTSYGEEAVLAVPALVTALEDEEWHVRKPVAEALASIGPAAADAVPALGSHLSDEEWQVRNAAAIALAAIPSEEAVTALSRSLTDEEWHVAANASMALAEVGAKAEPAVDYLVNALQHEEWHVRNNAAFALGMIGAESAIDGLKSILNDEEAKVSATAQDALRKLQGIDSKK
ncbi:MAG: HEAT repeat protein [Verrucomicrobiales bacterium]|jgi:HEAT repeat protein